MPAVTEEENQEPKKAQLERMLSRSIRHKSPLSQEAHVVALSPEAIKASHLSTA